MLAFCPKVGLQYLSFVLISFSMWSVSQTRMTLYGGELVSVFQQQKLATENQQVVSALKNYAHIGMDAPMNSPYYSFARCIPIHQSIKCPCIHPQYIS